jgi:hypothetical protein
MNPNSWDQVNVLPCAHVRSFCRQSVSFSVLSPLQLEPIPAVEWWDRGLLAHACLEQDVPELPAEVTRTEAMGCSHGEVEAKVDEMDMQGSGMDEQPGVQDASKQGTDRVGVDENEQPGGRNGGRQALEALAAAVQKAATDAAAGQLGPFHLKEARVSGAM